MICESFISIYLVRTGQSFRASSTRSSLNRWCWVFRARNTSKITIFIGCYSTTRWAWIQKRDIYIPIEKFVPLVRWIKTYRGGGGALIFMAVNILPFRNKETPWQCSTLLRETRRVTVQNDAFYAASSARAFLRDQLPAQFLVASSPRLALDLAEPSRGWR